MAFMCHLNYGDNDVYTNTKRDSIRVPKPITMKNLFYEMLLCYLLSLE